MGMMVDLDTLAHCSTCTTPQLPGAGPCLYCRAIEAEGKLQSLSFWGDSDWMRKIASIAVDDSRPDKALTPLGFEVPLSSCRTGPMQAVARPQVPFKPVLLTVDPAVAPLGVLLDAKIGNRSQYSSMTPIPLTVFSPLHWASPEAMREVVGRWVWDTANVALDIALVIDMTLATYDPLVEEARKAMNLPVPTHFRAALWGRAMDDRALAMETQSRYRVAPAGIEDVQSIQATLTHHDLVGKMRQPR